MINTFGTLYALGLPYRYFVANVNVSVAIIYFFKEIKNYLEKVGKKVIIVCSLNYGDDLDSTELWKYHQQVVVNLRLL